MRTRKFNFVFSPHFASVLVFFLFVFLAIGSTASVPPGKITVDPNVPAEKSAVVKFHSSLNIKEYNGIDVREEWYPKGKWRIVTATIPGGETNFLFDMHASFKRGNTIYHFRREDLGLKFNFEAGKGYTVIVYAKYAKNEGTLFSPKQIVFLAILDGDDMNFVLDVKENLIIKEWELGEF